MQKPSIPKGTRDFSPSEMSRRMFIFQSIREVFNSYGYVPIETPAMENLSTLLGKYGEEGDKLLFKILNSGDFKSKVSEQEWKQTHAATLGAKISENGLRYDLTVPFARYVVQHRNDITFPFKRYQIQPVWRADRPQKGRYREFYQCDVDVIGSDSLLNEFELISIIDDVFDKLSVKSVIKFNNRKILSGIADIIGEPERMVDITVAIDKIEKIGMENVILELSGKGLSENAISNLKPFLEFKGDDNDTLSFLENFLSHSDTGLQGIREIRQLLELLKADPLKADFELDITLARGLNYYTGAIIEVKSKDVNIGSICGGGRYDDLTGIFGLEGVSGVGVSFGADRIYDVMLQLDLFPEESEESTQVLFVNFGEKEAKYILPLLRKLREEGIPSELYPDNARMKKQMTYANHRKIPYVALVGEEEMKNGVVTLKDMVKGTQHQYTLQDIIDHLG